MVREILIRRSPLKPGKWLTFLVLCVCLAISALYELVEWWAALIGGEGADAFLGTQGDQWDTQWDMFMALLGAATALLLLSRLHDRQIARLEEAQPCLSTRRRCGGSSRATAFLKGRYSREHTWTFDGGLTVPASPSPGVVPVPWSNPAHVDPEEAYVAAISSCHMLTFLYVAMREGFVVQPTRTTRWA